MKILAIDDERLALESLMDAIRSAAPNADIQGFRYADDALEYAEGHACDIAFCDIRMVEMNGITLAEKLKEIHPRINIIFATGFSLYHEAAFNLYASAYLVKPITTEKVRDALEHLRYPVAEGKRLRLRAFGNFEVLCDGLPVTFKYSKSKELLAYLVDRKGALCTVGECIATLFEDDGHDTYFKSIRRDLLDTFEKLGCGSLIAHERGKIGVVLDEAECDYFNYLRGNRRGVNDFVGEYMTQYSWGEKTLAELSAKRQRES